MIFIPPGTTQISIVGKLVDASGAIIANKSNGSFQTPVTIAANSFTGMSFGTLTLATLASGTASFSAGGIVYLGNGDYRLDFTTSGLNQVITISAEGTLGSFLVETVLITSTGSSYFGINVVSVNGSALAASALSFFNNTSIDTSSHLIRSNLIIDSGTTVLDVNVTQIAGDSSAPLSLVTLARSSPGSIVVSSPIVSASTINLVPGDDYLANDSRSLDFTFTGAPDLSGATVSFLAPNFTIAGSILTSASVRFEPTAAATLVLPVGEIPFRIVATISSGSTITLGRGLINTR